MEYYIELDNLQTSFRLQKDKSWRELTDRSFIDTDYLTSNIYEIIKLQEIDGEIELGGKVWKLNSTESTIGEFKDAYYEIFAKRQVKPILPSKEQLISVIKQGDDRVYNTLILNSYGLFELRDFHTMNFAIKDPTIIIRHETFVAGNGYVGIEASNHTNFVDSMYADSLKFWLIHLQTGQTNMLSDMNTNSKIVDLITEINSIHI